MIDGPQVLELPSFTDAELTEQALAAHPEVVIDSAIPLAELIGRASDGALPDWYMPAPMGGGTHLVGWRRGVIFSFIASLLVIEAFGLCTTYGQIV